MLTSCLIKLVKCFDFDISTLIKSKAFAESSGLYKYSNKVGNTISAITLDKSHSNNAKISLITGSIEDDLIQSLLRLLSIFSAKN